MKDQLYICDHYESCPDEDCPHKIPHKWRDIAHVSDPCDGDICGYALFGSDCVPIEEM
jgi:hypothetical protein